MARKYNRGFKIAFQLWADFRGDDTKDIILKHLHIRPFRCDDCDGKFRFFHICVNNKGWGF